MVLPYYRVCLWSEILQLHSYYIERGAMNPGPTVYEDVELSS